MRVSRWLSFIFISCLCLSCGKTLPVLEGLDIIAWKNDRGGCLNKRSTMVDAIRKEKNKLLSLNEVEVINVLGRPDRNELFKRNQKFYHYFLQPSEVCSAPLAKPMKLSVRFNAVGLAKEIVIE
jgi:hypothetical protein